MSFDLNANRERIVNKPKTKRPVRETKGSIDRSARDIVYQVQKVDRRYRGYLFDQVAVLLEKNQKFGTARVFRSMANTYGVIIPPEYIVPEECDNEL